MSAKKKLYTFLLAASLCLVGAAFLLRNSGLPYRVNAALFGMATTLSCVGVPRLLALWSEEASRSKVLSGDLLQWSCWGCSGCPSDWTHRCG